MDEMKLKAAMRALDDLLDMLDERDANDAKGLKEGHGDATSDESRGDPAAMEKSMPDDGKGEQAKGDGKSLRDELDEMSGHSTGAKNALDLFKDDEDEDE